ncbi:hypothetical protein DMA12_48060 [Amycolatopsis balhimycina DSM 5908]|uniref:NB-ARC domain-containing protein n=1 Tax=Amycolatopsis balhimycina DSM 5908 TaxID=1081091 RepID=A0A428VUJ4_AMYBA|nr:hypothetical protein DMA12_48060 [Amycolatopsis balhimycina DSM 5908]
MVNTQCLPVLREGGAAEEATGVTLAGDTLKCMVREADKGGSDCVPRQLPSTVRDFTGRADYLAALDALISEGDDAAPSGAVVISAVDGTAGIGKTTLAVYWAHRTQHHFPDGTLYANLRGYGPGELATPGEVLGGFLSALGVPAERMPPSIEAQAGLYRSLLAERRVLVVLDNAKNAEQVRPLLPASAGSVVVVTSRDSLTGLVVTEGATRLTLDLLSLDEAMALVAGIVGTLHAEAEPDALAELVRLCARLPLALRIAAGRVAAGPQTTVAEVVNELTDDRYRLDVLSRNGDERAAVRAVFDWSYEQLMPVQASLFRRLGLHPGPDFSLHAAAALTDLKLSEVRQQLEGLSTAHLIEPVGGSRYRFHDLLRTYACDQALRFDTNEDRDYAVERFLNWYGDTAYRCDELLYPAHPRTPRTHKCSSHLSPEIKDSAQALAWLEAERANMLPSLQQAVDNELHEQAVHLAQNSRFLSRHGRWVDELRGARLGLVAAERSGDRVAETRFRNWLGEVLITAEKWNEALENLEHALTLAREIPLNRQLANALNGIGLLRCLQGHFEEGLPYLHEALPLSRGIDTGRLEAVIQGNLSSAFTGLGLYKQALEHGERGLILRRRAGDLTGVVYAMHCLARAWQGLGQHQKTISLCREAIADGRAVDYTPHAVAEPLDTLGIALNSTGRCADAVKCWREAATLFDGYNRPHRAAEVRARIKAAEAALGKIGQS